MDELIKIEQTGIAVKEIHGQCVVTLSVSLRVRHVS